MVLFNLKTRYLRATWAASLLLVGAAHAQTAAPPASAFDRYKPYTDEPIGNWKAANDTTARIGGWREYAKQAQGLDSRPDNTPASANKARAAAPEPIKKAQP